MKTTFQKPVRPLVKPHFQTLDGLRGVAAIAVLVFHFVEFVRPDYTQNFIAHGYLAVDFFFCLSGFVIAYAYDNKIRQLGVWRFFRLRLIRLQPMVVIGAVIGLLCFVLDPFRHLYTTLGAGKTALMFLATSLIIPYPAVLERSHNLFHLNPPIWSLMWEYIANIVYALILFRIPQKTLATLTVIAAVGLCVTAHVHGNLGVGWGVGNAAGGVVRVASSFLLGMLVYRSGWRITNSLGFAPIGFLLLLAFMVPYRHGLNQFTEPVLVLLYFPLLIALGAGTRIGSFWSEACKQLGDLSYPLYIVHYPFLWVFLSYLETEKPPMSQLKVVVPVLGGLLIVFSYLIAVLIDAPIRRYLSRSKST